MFKPIRRLVSAAVLLALTGLLVLVAKQFPDFFFSFYPKISRTIISYISVVTGVLPFALWEILAGGLLLSFLTSFFVDLSRGRLLRWATGWLVTVCAAVFFFVGAWGLNYFAPPMEERIGLDTQEYTPAQLREATEYYLAQTNAAAENVSRDEQGVFVAADLSELSDAALESYEALDMDCFDGPSAPVKKLLTSRLFGATGTTGIFIAFTGESCISSTTFSRSVPYTVCHEIAHRMAFARENEANFAAFLACSVSDRADLRYSGYYAAFVYCYNALSRVDPDAAGDVWAMTSEHVRTDAAASRAHYDKVENKKAVAVTDKVYDTYLKTFSVESGKQSYGEVVDLLAAWYFEEIK